MTLIKSISGIRGTIGGAPDEGLTPLDIVKFTSAYAKWIKTRTRKNNYKVVIGRDARVSGEMVERIVSGSLAGMGVDVVSLGLATTPTVEIAVIKEKADGGIIITASHNPGQWNALKLVNSNGEFLSAEDGEKIIKLTLKDSYTYAYVEQIGKFSEDLRYSDIHINDILKLKLVKPELIKKAGFRIAIDCVNSVGGIIIPKFLKSLGVREVYELYCLPNGIFPHNPEPLPENLSDISRLVKEKKADVGFVVDPDVDRLAIICEDGSMFGEEYTLVAVADYILDKTPGNTASNLSSSRALRDITIAKGQKYFTAPVGEVNVVDTMKANQCVIGGEGNGGIIYPELHYGRDALVGIGLFLTLLAEKKMKCSDLRKTFPEYVISKNKIVLSEGMDIDAIFNLIKDEFKSEKIDIRDGIKIDLIDGWIHLRKSNTEPVIRIYAEARDLSSAQKLAKRIIKIINV
jgi:phosphomannomutase